MKKLLTILVLIMLIISFFQITSMYALYKERIQGEYDTLLGAWEIKVNGTDVTTSGQVETFEITDDQLEYIDSEYVQAGKIAPNAQAYFDIVLDPTGTDVAVIYEIDIDKKALSTIGTNTEIQLANAIEFIRAENYFELINENGEVETITNEDVSTNENKYTGLIPIDKINGGFKNYIRLYFKWKNVTETTTVDDVVTVVESNNEFDTAIGETEGTKLTIPIKINLKQYTGEVIGIGE